MKLFSWCQPYHQHRRSFPHVPGVSASLVIRYEGMEVVLPCHPGDALALALRADGPIVATDEALAHACPVDEVVRTRALRHWLDGLTPADFADHSDGTSA